MRTLINYLLDDENGISEKAYIQLQETIQKLVTHPMSAAEAEQLTTYLSQNAEATDGRFYFP